MEEESKTKFNAAEVMFIVIDEDMSFFFKLLSGRRPETHFTKRHFSGDSGAEGPNPNVQKQGFWEVHWL